MKILPTSHVSLKRIQNMPTIKQGQFDNLKYDDGMVRLWLSRMTIEDGMEYNNQVTIEEYRLQKDSKGVIAGSPKTWQIVKQYEAK